MVWSDIAVARDLAHVERLKEDIERQTRSVTEDKILINSERQIMSKISAEISEKESALAKQKESLQATKDQVEKTMERLATERVEIAYQLKILTDERIKASAAAKEAREAELKLKSKSNRPNSRRRAGYRSSGAQQQWPHKSHKEDGLSYTLRMQLLMAELERERQAIAHNKKRNTILLETQEKYLYEANSELARFHLASAPWSSNPKAQVWSDPISARPTPLVDQKSEDSKLTENTTFTDLTQITSDED